MKRKVILAIMCTLLFSTLLCGCGYKNISKMTDGEIYSYVSKMDENELEKFLSSLDLSERKKVERIIVNYGFTDFLVSDVAKIGSDVAQDNEVETQEIEKPVFQTYSAKPEIVNANFTDFIFQVDDVVFYQDYTRNVTEMLTQFSSEFKACGEDKNELNMERLVAGEPYCISLYKGDEYVLSFWAKNYNEGTIELKDCAAIGMDINKYYKGSIYCAKGIQLNESDDENCNINFTYDRIADTIASFDLADFWAVDGQTVYDVAYIKHQDTVDLQYTIETTSSFYYWDGNEYGGEHLNEHPSYSIDFIIDPDTRKSDVYFSYTGTLEWE